MERIPINTERPNRGGWIGGKHGEHEKHVKSECDMRGNDVGWICETITRLPLSGGRALLGVYRPSGVVRHSVMPVSVRYQSIALF